MEHTPDQLSLYGRLGEDIEALCKEAHEFGVSHRMLAVILLEKSINMAMAGGVQCFFDNILWLETQSHELMEEFEKRFGEKIDMDELMKGRVVAKHTTVQ